MIDARTHDAFELVSDFEPSGDQPGAIDALCEGMQRGDKHQTLLGVTGSGKTFSIACMVERLNRPTLVMSPNKTLAAQLYAEIKELFPNNAVEYFVSYYDYYQPEAYIPSTDTYIEKDSSINDEIDKLRHSATKSILERRDTVMVASVSCIYGLGAPENYGSMHVYVETGMNLVRDDLLRRLVDMQYDRNDHDFHRGTFRVRGDVVEIFPQYEGEMAIRIEFFGDEVDSIAEIAPLRGKVVARPKKAMIYPASHYVASQDRIRRACDGIREELQERLAFFEKENKLLEAQRLEQRTMYDLEMLETMGFCHGVENYSRWLDGRSAGQTPYTLYDYLPEGTMVVLDESHVSVPQIGGMYRGDRARKETLVDFGWRMPSALDNRPLRFDEWEERAGQRVYVSATPADYELEACKGVVVEQIIRPTGLVDPKIEIRPATGQVDDLLAEIQTHVQKEERVLVTTLTKRMAEELTDYYAELGVRIRYLHSDIKTMERMEIIRELREGRVRRARRDQPVARGARHSRGRAGRDSRRRQGGLPALDPLADPDDRARRAEREGTGDPVRGQRDGLDPRDARRDRPPTHYPGGLQRRARHHAHDHPEAHLQSAGLDLGAGLRDRSAGGREARARTAATRAAGPDRDAPQGDAGGGARARVRARGRASRPCEGARGRAHPVDLSAIAMPTERTMSSIDRKTPPPRASTALEGRVWSSRPPPCRPIPGSICSRARGARCSTWARPRT